jgi:hypothetical protein
VERPAERRSCEVPHALSTHTCLQSTMPHMEHAIPVAVSRSSPEPGSFAPGTR